jgi:hypothetical protein
MPATSRVISRRLEHVDRAQHTLLGSGIHGVHASASLKKRFPRPLQPPQFTIASANSPVDVFHPPTIQARAVVAPVRASPNWYCELGLHCIKLTIARSPSRLGAACQGRPLQTPGGAWYESELKSVRSG